MSNKFCVDCKHHVMTLELTHQCKQLELAPVSLVTGKQTYRDAEELRKTSPYAIPHCGPLGRYWEKK